MSQDFWIRPIENADRDWMTSVLREHWGSERIVTRGRAVEADRLDGYIAFLGDERVGVVTFDIRDGECEVVSLDALRQGIGIGTALLESARQVALASRCRRMWLITTNDNLAALRFYQKRGMRLAALYPNALAVSRQLKPQIPEIGLDAIPLRDEIELEYTFE